MKILGVICARGGSKGLVNKNIRLLHDKPLIVYTIEEAIKSNVFETLILNTDSQEIADCAKEYDIEIPFIRPTHLATDNAKIKDVLIDTLNWYSQRGQNYTHIFLLQPTSPLRTSEDIRGMLTALKERKCSSVVAVSEALHSPDTYFELNNDCINPKSIEKVAHVNRQELKRFYKINGAGYLVDVDLYRKYNTWFFEDTYAYLMPRKRSIDIDDIDDFEYADYLLTCKET